MKVNFTQEQLKNLEVFLLRVELKGAEVPAFVEIINAINKVEKDEKDS